MLSNEAIEDAASIFAEARRANTMVSGLPDACRPHCLEDAYRIQDAHFAKLDCGIDGWFSACTNEAIQTMLGLHEPYYARLLSPHTFPSPATLDTEDYPPMVFECEFGFRTGRGFAPEDHPISPEEVAASVVEVCPMIEVVAARLEDWTNQDVFSVIADNGTDGAWVVGEGQSDWRHLDLPKAEVRLTVDDEVVRVGSGAKVLGDPFEAFVWLVNALTRDGRHVHAGHVHNTGTATDIYWATKGEHAVAEFEGVGSVELTLE